MEASQAADSFEKQTTNTNFEIVDPNELPETWDAHPFSISLNSFLKGMDDFRDAVNLSLPAVLKSRNEEMAKQLKELEKYVKVEEEGTKKVVAKGAHAASHMLNTVDSVKRISEAKVTKVIERSLFVGLFSEYDVFIGNLMKAIYCRKPELFRGIKREISLPELLNFDDLDAVKADMLSKEIDAFRRESYIEQFAILEKKFDITLTKFPEWATFVEISQRRNLMTHNDGIVSEQYLNVCKKEGFKFEKMPAVGDDLKLGGPYFSSSIAILSKVAFMLTHTLWRKILPRESELAHSFMNKNIYDLLKRKRWILASEFGMFSLSAGSSAKISEIDHRMRVINTAIVNRPGFTRHF